MPFTSIFIKSRFFNLPHFDDSALVHRQMDFAVVQGLQKITHHPDPFSGMGGAKCGVFRITGMTGGIFSPVGNGVDRR